MTKDGVAVLYEETCFIFRRSVPASATDDSFDHQSPTEPGHTEKTEPTLNAQLERVRNV